MIGGRSGDAAAFGNGQGEAGFCPSVQTDAPAANQKAAGAASCCCLLLSVVRPLGWMKAGWCVPVSGCLRRGLPWQGVDNYLATLARLRSGRVMGIGTAEAGGGRSSALGLEG